ncbi:hypothetical protein H6P81_002760 [Aristolochia fimbriata]|uniref:Uncharacterized protein n=1 Tax=Aristolochia fimbriata TaxID=158543 RepID=A0AAV7FES4_ARIFI|nr:hypothetical protein H6P81_002760 [Aristolochia fimbriata]
MALMSMSCLQPVSNQEASYISPLEEGPTPELVAKDRENQQFREGVGHLEEQLSLREGCSVDSTVQFEEHISEMGLEPHIEVKKHTIKPGPSIRTPFIVTYKRPK